MHDVKKHIANHKVLHIIVGHALLVAVVAYAHFGLHF